MQKGQGPPHSVGKFPGHPEKDRGQQGPGTATCAPWPGKPQPGPAAFGTGPRSTSGPRPARLHLNLDPGLGQRVPHRCPLPLPSLTKGQALLQSPRGRGPQAHRGPGHCPQLTHLCPRASQLALGARPLQKHLQPLPGMATGALAPDQGCPQPTRDRGPPHGEHRVSLQLLMTDTDRCLSACPTCPGLCSSASCT